MSEAGAKAKRRKYVVHRYTEYIIKSYVIENGQWVYETDVAVVPSYETALARVRRFRLGLEFPSDFASFIRREEGGKKTND
jgi:hypothetical protein